MAYNKIDQERVRQALGSSRVESMQGLPSRGPLDLMGLQEHFRQRLRSSGGRPSDPERTLGRTVRFQPAQWSELEQLAVVLGREGRAVSPAQLAALLVEHGLLELTQGGNMTSVNAAVLTESARGAVLLADTVYEGFDRPIDCLERQAA